LERIIQSDLSLPSWLGWLLLVLGFILVVYLLSRLLDWRPSPPRASRRAATLLEVTDGVADDWDQALNLAQEALESGDQRRCLWLSHRLLLHRLDQADSIVFEKSKTNRVYLQECRSSEHSGLLGKLTELYEEVIYAHRSSRLNEVANLFREVEKL
jgi:hypothetical protein